MIITDESALRVKCEDVSSDEVDQLRIQLEKELKLSGDRGSPGIGLAAPQIGIAKRMAIIRLNNIEINLINATIVDKYDEMIFEGEGCLSFPGKIVKSKRFNEIRVINGCEPSNFVATGMLAVVIQHELNHLEGILLPDVEIKEIKKKVRPNDLCPCGSGKKYKKCCGK